MQIFINCQGNGRTWTKKDYLFLASNGTDYQLEDLDKHPSVSPECVLNIEPYRRIVRGTKWTGIWEIDLLLDRQEYCTDNWSQARDVFVAIPEFPARLKNYEAVATLLWQACDPEIHKPIDVPYEERIYDFVLAGTFDDEVHRERKRLVDLLIKNGFAFKYLGKEHPPLRFPQMYQEGRVQFIRSMGNDWGKGECAQRFFECLAIGPVLTDRNPHLAYLTDLVEGEDYLAYESDEELLNKFSFLVKNPDEARMIAASGRKKALAKHTYKHRLETIWRTMCTRL